MPLARAQCRDNFRRTLLTTPTPSGQEVPRYPLAPFPSLAPSHTMAALCSASPAISTAASLGLPARRVASLLRLRLRAAARSYSAAAEPRAAAPSWRARRRFAASAASTTEESSGVDTMIPPDNRIPATIITGFLGSGKVRALNPVFDANEPSYAIGCVQKLNWK